MTRQSTKTEGSLELLLDTICNTFGGVLFISILVVLLLNNSSRRFGNDPPDEAVQQELIRLRQEMEQTSQEMQRLRQAAEIQMGMEQSIYDPDAERLVEELRQAQAEQAERLERKTSVLGETGESQIKVNQVAEERKRIEEELQRFQRDLSTAQERLKRELQSRTETSQLPKERKSKKQQAGFILARGRLIACSKRAPQGQLILNTAECELIADGQYVEEKAGAGLRVDPEDIEGRQIAARISEFDPDKHYLLVAVRPDSFEHFRVVRDVMVQKKFAYKLEPIPANYKLPVGGPPSEETDVQGGQ